MIARSLLLLSSVALITVPAAAQSSHHVLKGDSVAIYNLVGELRVEAGSGSDVAVDVQRGGADAAKLDIQSGPLRGRETLRIILSGRRDLDAAMGPRLEHHAARARRRDLR